MMGMILVNRVFQLGQLRFLALGMLGAFLVGPVLAGIWPPTPDPTIADSSSLAAGMISLWLLDLIFPLWFVLFYMRFFFFIPRGEIRIAPAGPNSMRRGELERDAQLRALGFAGLGQFEAHIVGRSWNRYWAYANSDGSTVATLVHSGFRSIVCFSTYWTNGFYVCAFHGPRGLAVAPASAEKRVLLLRGTLREAYEQYSAEIAHIELRTPATVVMSTSLDEVIAHEREDMKTLPALAALVRRSKPSLVLGAVAAIVLVFGLLQTVTFFPWG
jgi:hypothetical protein